MPKGELTDWVDTSITSIAMAFEVLRKNKSGHAADELNTLAMTMAVLTDELARRTNANL